MPQQYVATDKESGLEVTITGEFPEDPDDRVRIARTSTLFTRLMSTILAMDNITERREGFRAVETQLEVAESLLRRDVDEVQRLIRSTLERMGITEDRLGELEAELRRHLEEFGGYELPPDPPPPDDTPLDDRGLDDRLLDDRGFDDTPRDDSPPEDRD